MCRQPNRLFLLGLICLLMLSFKSAIAAENENWQDYVYTSDGFAISSPSQPFFNKQMINTKAGIPVELRSYTILMGGTTCILGVIDYSSSNFDMSEPQKFLANARDGAINNVHGKLISQVPISLGNNPGLQFDGETNQYNIRERMYLVSRTLYQIVLVAPQGQPYPPAFVRVADSFHFVPRH